MFLKKRVHNNKLVTLTVQNKIGDSDVQERSDVHCCKIGFLDVHSKLVTLTCHSQIDANMRTSASRLHSINCLNKYPGKEIFVANTVNTQYILFPIQENWIFQHFYVRNSYYNFSFQNYLIQIWQIQLQIQNNKFHFSRLRLKNSPHVSTCKIVNPGVIIRRLEVLFDAIDLRHAIPETTILAYAGTTRFLVRKQGNAGSHVRSTVPQWPLKREKDSLVPIKDVGY